MRKLPKQFFFQAMWDLTIRWQKCLTVNGAYFEGMHVPVDIEVVQVEETDEDSDSEQD